MAEKSRQQQFEREFRGQIGRLAGPVVSALRGITEASLSDEIGVLSFVIHSRGSSFPVFVHAMDSVSPDEVYFDPPFSGEVLVGAGPLIPPGAIDRDGYEADGVATYEVGARVLAEWFGECWHEVGGASFPIAAHISHHDQDAYYDLWAAGGPTSPTSGTDRTIPRPPRGNHPGGSLVSRSRIMA